MLSRGTLVTVPLPFGVTRVALSQRPLRIEPAGSSQGWTPYIGCGPKPLPLDAVPPARTVVFEHVRVWGPASASRFS